MGLILFGVAARAAVFDGAQLGHINFQDSHLQQVRLSMLEIPLLHVC
jgi:hypothetical protein